MDLLIIWLATTVSLLVISRIGLFGIEIEDFGTALVVAVALGLLNALLRPILNFLSFPVTTQPLPNVRLSMGNQVIQV